MIFFYKAQRSAAIPILAEMGVPRTARVEIKDENLFLAARGGMLLVVEDSTALLIPAKVIDHAKTPGWITITAKMTSARFNAAGGGFR